MFFEEKVLLIAIVKGIIIAFATISFAQPAAPLVYGGKTYKTVKIGEQTWMAENLNYETKCSYSYKCYYERPPICAKYGLLYNWETAKKACPKGWYLPNNAEWDPRFAECQIRTESPYKSPAAGKYSKAKSGLAKNLNYEAEGSVCYKNNPANCAKYGRLYNWETAMNVCPKGWHLPSNAEWNELLRFVDGEEESTTLYESPTAGKHLKATSGWDDNEGKSGNGTDKYGFSALPGGNGHSGNRFNSVGKFGGWWRAEEGKSSYAYHRIMSYLNDEVYWFNHVKPTKFSVRCIKDGEKYISKGNNINNYKTVVIGTQTWMAENLDYAVEGSKCYNNNPANCAKYGRLYNWQAAKKVCPKGWHLPSNAEWDKLSRFVDGDKGTESPYKSPTAGKQLKAVSGWNSYKGSDGNGTDAHGFSALPAGDLRSIFFGAGYSGIWWSTNEFNSTDKLNNDYAYSRQMSYSSDIAYSGYDLKSFFFSVRCLQN